jgi:hypothetical protein
MKNAECHSRVKTIPCFFQEGGMRSELVFGAMRHISNRFLLAKALAEATRRLHKPGTRTQDTTNDALIRFGYVNPIAQEDAIPIVANIPRRRSRPSLAIRQQSKHSNVPAIREGRHALPGVVRVPGNWAKV